MSAQIETSPNQDTINMEPTVDGPISPQKQFLAHLGEYPIVNSTREAVLTIPLTKKVATIVTPPLRSVREAQPIKTIMDRGDIIANGALTQMDKLAPTLKTLEVHDITDHVTRPVHGVIEGVHQTMGNVNDTLQKTFVDPSKKVVHDLRDRFHSTVYDNNGKGIISSKADPLVAPINESLEKIVDNCFPEIKKVSKDGHSSEFARTVRIVSNVITRSQEKSAETIANEEAEVASDESAK